MRAFLVALLGGASAAAAIGACVLPTFTRLDGQSGGGGQASSGVGGMPGFHCGGGTGGHGGDGPNSCTHPTYPAYSGPTKLGGDISFVGALHKVYLTHDENNGPLGLDLDGVCTCIAGGASSCVPKDISKTTYCDQAGGRDDGVVNLFAGLSLLLQADPGTFYSETVDKGYWGLLFKVSDYNGKCDDDQVTFAMVASAGYGTIMDAPKWDGNDKWPVSTTSFALDANGKPDLSTPKYVDKNAYVTHGVLVASSVPGTEMTLASVSSRITFRTSAGGLMATIATDAKGRWVLRHGLMTGKASVKQMFQAIASYRDQNGTGICKDPSPSSIFAIVKQKMCDGLDILADKNGSPNDACDALSVAVGFETDPAQFGAGVTPNADKPACTPATDPSNECCDCPFGYLVDPATCKCTKQ